MSRQQVTYHLTEAYRLLFAAPLSADALEALQSTGAALRSLGVDTDTLLGGDERCEGCDGSGIRDLATPDCGCGDRHHIVERCDTCEVYDSDFAAARALYGEQAFEMVDCPFGYHHAAAEEGK